jgi:L,D-transpeptidase catalytic domain/Putative peptidoglycan binding domain/Sporulation and spore germination
MAGSNRLRAGGVTALVVALGATGCLGGDDDDDVASPPAAPEDQAEQAAPAGQGKRAAELYFTSGEQFRKVERELPESGSELERVTEALVAGPTARERDARVEAQTQIPDGVEVEGVALAADGTATVRLSRGFFAGVPEAATERTRAQQDELDARVGQVAYTLTQFPRVEDAKVVAGGIGIEPTDREDFEKPKRRPEPEPGARGAASASTRAIQRRLARLRFLPKAAVDGRRGYRTQQAVIAFQSWEGLARDGIVGPITQAALDSARRPKPRASADGDRIEVFRAKGVALVVNDGRVKRAIHVSTGAPGTETPAGTFSVFRKEKMSWSYPFQQWLPWASYFFQGIAFHEYASVPTYPASHGCVRVPEPEARWLYRYADIGMKVVVF